MRNVKNLIYILLSLLCTVGIFAYLLQNIAPGDVFQVIKDVDYRYLLAFLVLSIAGSIFRAVRYQLTLLPAGHSPPLFTIFLITLVRNVFSDLLPARIGTTVYIYLAHSRLGIPLHLATSSFALSFLFDILALGPLMVLVLLFAQVDLPFDTGPILIAAGILFVLSVLIVVLLPQCFSLARRILKRFPGLPVSLRARLLNFCEQIGSEVALARHSGIYSSLFILSVFVRLCKYGSLYLFLLGIVIPLGINSSQANVLVSSIGILSAELAASLPVSGIAGFGAYEGAWAMTFSLLGFPDEIAKLTAISHHLFTQVYGYGIGGLALLVLLLPGLKRESFPDNFLGGRIYIMFKYSTLFLITCALAAICLSLPKTAKSVSHLDDQIPENSINELRSTLQSLPGVLIFDSNRNGSFGIYKLDPESLESKTLIDTPAEEMYPDPSPDGKLIVYARSISLSRNAPSEVWLADRNGENRKKLVDDGTFPTFSSDGSQIYYEVQRSKVMVYSLETGESKEIFPKNKKNFKNLSVVKPRVSPDDKFVAFTSDKPDRWHAWLAPLSQGKPTQIGRGCEPSWFPDGNRLAWVKRSGLNAGSGLMDFSLSDQKATLLQDDGPPLGHEYFPSVANQGEALLYAACPADQHDHVSAAYQLHIKNLKSNKVQQVTYNSATNRWPKLLLHK